MCASQNFTASRTQSSSFIAKHPVSGFRGHEFVGDHGFNLKKVHQEGQLLQQERRLFGVPVSQSRDCGSPRESGGGSRVHQRGVLRLRHASTLAPVHLVIQRVIPSSFSKGAALDQMKLPLLCRLDAPSVVPHQLIELCKDYRDAVRLCWELRRVKNMTRRRLAEDAGLYPPHVTCYLNDGKRQRDLPGGAVRGFEWACGNTAISQWHALQAHLTVLEEMQAQRRAA